MKGKSRGAHTSPLSRTKKSLQEDGYTVEITEYMKTGYDAKTRRAFAYRKDLLGIGDLLALKAGQPPLLVQCTNIDHFAERVQKVQNSHLSPLWLACGGRAAVWGWSLKQWKGKTKKWQPTVWEMDGKSELTQQHEKRILTSPE